MIRFHDFYSPEQQQQQGTRAFFLLIQKGGLGSHRLTSDPRVVVVPPQAARPVVGIARGVGGAVGRRVVDGGLEGARRVDEAGRDTLVGDGEVREVAGQAGVVGRDDLELLGADVVGVGEHVGGFVDG